VHADEDAGALARSYSARAFATGHDIVFAPGEYRPATESGRRLLAHELAHVVHPAAPGTLARVPDAGAGTLLEDAGVPAPAGVAPDAGQAAATGAGLFGGVPAPPLPITPDACSTVEEEERKTKFRSRMFSAQNFKASYGYGNFDAFYWPAASLMSAIVKMKFNYVEADNTPPAATLWQMWLAGQDITPFFWTNAEKTQFAEDYRNRVIARWSFAHTFRSNKPCWPFIAMPYVAPRVVDDVADAHFEVTVHKSPGGIDYKSGFDSDNPGTAGWRGTGDLYQSDVQEAANFRSDDVARSERQRLERAVAAAAASPILFAKDSAVIQPADLARLRTLAAAMNAKNPSDPAIPITISGFASSEGPLARNEKLADDRANAVADALLAAGVPQPLIIVRSGPVGAPNDAANRKVDIVPSTTFEGTYASNRYSVAEHEFGHTLGLPDEYVNNTTGKNGARQTAIDTLAATAGVAKPDRWGDVTASQMSGGVDVLPRHYLTLWEALGQMTSPDITRNEWTID
jgi:outer membrane protein OmpA-like peptidoglycan-associated protein